jgi:phosphatidylglycerophosphatase A
MIVMDSRMDKIRKFMLQEEEDDDEFFLVLLPTIYSSLYEEKCPVHISSLSCAKLVKKILEGHESWYRVKFRMEPEIFRLISNYLKREKLLEDTTRVGVDEQLGMFMYMISHNATNQDLQKKIQHSAETVHRKMNEIFNLIPTLVQRFVKVPTSLQLHPKIMSNPRFWPYFQENHYFIKPIQTYPYLFLNISFFWYFTMKNCIGAIDGTYIW